MRTYDHLHFYISNVSSLSVIVRNVDLQAEGFGTRLLLFAFLTCLFCCFVFKETFSPEHVEFNSGK